MNVSIPTAADFEVLELTIRLAAAKFASDAEVEALKAVLAYARAQADAAR